jgi:DNA-binding GntR family transcriptional regulator
MALTMTRAPPYAGAMATRKPIAVSKPGAEMRICAAVRTAILERRLAPGTKLPEIELGAQFDVSRTIVRQALRTLAHEGIVALRDRRIAVVARPSAGDVAHLFAARRAIEGSVVEHAVGRMTRSEIAALRRLVHDEEAAYRRGDRAAGLGLSLGFHHRLGTLCGNPVLERYLNELVLQTSLAVALYEQPDAVHAHADHLDLLDAIARRDARRAVRLMIEHLTDLERNLHLAEPRAAPTLAAILGSP